MKSTTRQRELRKAQDELVMVGAKVEPELHVEIKTIAQSTNVSIAYIVEEALTKYVERNKQEE